METELRVVQRFLYPGSGGMFPGFCEFTEECMNPAKVLCATPDNRGILVCEKHQREIT